jgi:hypothetical protein
VRLTHATDPRQRLVVVTSTGHPSVSELLRTLDAIFADPAYEPGFCFLYDRRRDLVAPEPEAARRLIDSLAERQHLIAGARCAVVLAPDVASARASLDVLDRMTGELDTAVRLFLRMEDALRWLGVQHAGAS